MMMTRAVVIMLMVMVMTDSNKEYDDIDLYKVPTRCMSVTK